MPPRGTRRSRRARWRWPGPSARAAFPRGSSPCSRRPSGSARPSPCAIDRWPGRRTAWRGVDPYKLFHREAAWYLIGRCHLHDEPRVFRLDRISDAATGDGRFEPPDFDLDAHLRHTWGVYRGRELHEVAIHFDAALAPLIEGGTHHPGERIEQLGNGGLEYRVTLSHLGEVARWIVSFGGQARAVAPPALVQIVADLGLLAYERHARGDDPSPTSIRRQQDLPGLVRDAAARQRSFNYDGQSG